MKLTVVTQDYISAWEAKGEILEGYFNPDNKFSSIDIILLNDDIPNDVTVAELCGNVPFRLFNFPIVTLKFMLLSLGWRPFILSTLMKPLLQWASSEPTDVVRAYETSLAAYSARAISQSVGCGYAISLHSTPDKKALRRYSTLKDRLVRRLTARAGFVGFRDATVIIAVYKSILGALTKENSKKAVIIPNVIGVSDRNRKMNYESNGPIKLLATGRLAPGKSPEKFIEALAKIDDMELTIIGDGPLKDKLSEQVKRLNLVDRVEFIKKIDNNLLCEKLSTFDAYVFHTDYQECPKTLIEAALVGLPIICSKDLQMRIPELQELSLITCDDDVNGFSNALHQISSETLRSSMGKKISISAHELWSPEVTAKKTADIFSSLVQ